MHITHTHGFSDKLTNRWCSIACAELCRESIKYLQILPWVKACLSTCSFIKPTMHGLLSDALAHWITSVLHKKSGFLLPSATSLRQFSFSYCWTLMGCPSSRRTRPKPLWNIRTCQLTRIGLSQQCPLEWPGLSWWLTRSWTKCT